MTARAFLVRGLVAGLLAGVAAFAVSYVVGEPHVEAAIAMEEAAAGHSHDHGHEDAVVSRDTQRTWGLLIGTLAVGVAIGGLAGIASAVALGRVGRLAPGQSTALVVLVGFVAAALVPFLKYPATPPAVGDPATIQVRTAAYFGFLLLSVVAAVAATVGATKVWRARGSYPATLAGVGGYLLVVLVAGALLPTVDEVGDFPASTLWTFRMSSIAVLTAMWTTLAVVLTGLVGRLHRRESAATARRELAASL